MIRTANSYLQSRVEIPDFFLFFLVFSPALESKVKVSHGISLVFTSFPIPSTHFFQNSASSLHHYHFRPFLCAHFCRLHPHMVSRAVFLSDTPFDVRNSIHPLRPDFAGWTMNLPAFPSSLFFRLFYGLSPPVFFLRRFPPSPPHPLPSFLFVEHCFYHLFFHSSNGRND